MIPMFSRNERTADQLDRIAEFLSVRYGRSYTDLPWERRLKATIDFRNAQRAGITEKRAMMQLFMGPIPLIISLIAWLVLLWKQVAAP